MNNAPSLASQCSNAQLPLPDFDKSAYQAADREEKEQLIKRVTEEAYELLAQDLKAGRSESLVAYLEAAGRFHQYSFNNMMLILLQRPDATRVAGFRAWNKFNRFVRKGEQGIVVLAPVTKVVGRHEETQADGSKKEVPIRRVVNTKPVYVFDVSQTDGDPLPEPERHAGDPGKYLSRLEKLYKKHGVTLEQLARSCSAWDDAGLARRGCHADPGADGEENGVGGRAGRVCRVGGEPIRGYRARAAQAAATLPRAWHARAAQARAKAAGQAQPRRRRQDARADPG